MRKLKHHFLLLSAATALLTATMAAADCSNQPILPNETLYFYHHSIGTYTINLNPTLQAIADGQDHSGYPYFEKTWTGSCPAGLDGNNDTCIEFTVYPDGTNFSPTDIMNKIEKYTHGKPNRGEVRVISDSSETQYVYTTDHENTFCGPYAVQTAFSKERN